jgi:hypothetical protein
MGSARGVGDLRAILRSTVAAIERAFGKIGNLSPDRKLSIALSLLDSADEKNRYAKITGGLSDQTAG